METIIDTIINSNVVEPGTSITNIENARSFIITNHETGQYPGSVKGNSLVFENTVYNLSNQVHIIQGPSQHGMLGFNWNVLKIDALPHPRTFSAVSISRWTSGAPANRTPYLFKLMIFFVNEAGEDSYGPLECMNTPLNDTPFFYPQYDNPFFSQQYEFTIPPKHIIYLHWDISAGIINKPDDIKLYCKIKN